MNSQLGPDLPTDDPSGQIFASAVHDVALSSGGEMGRMEASFSVKRKVERICVADSLFCVMFGMSPGAIGASKLKTSKM